jgi:transposase
MHYRMPEDKPKGAQCQKIVQGGGGKMMIWGSVTYNGVGPLVWVKENIKGAVYLAILKQHLPGILNHSGTNAENFYFQHDNARVHTAKPVKAWIAASGIKLLDWPANSPDMNIIENLWAIVKRELYDIRRFPKEAGSLDDLWRRLQEVWYSIPLDTIRRLYKSIPTRIEEVIRSHGKTTGF